MKRIKNILSVMFLAIIVLLIAVQVFAHPGGTDEYGGHYDNNTGEYHYHHGYPAHQHTNGECPYDFDDNVDHNRSSSGYGSRNSTFYRTSKRNMRTREAFEQMQIPNYYSYSGYEKKQNTVYYVCAFCAVCSVFWLYIQFMNWRDEHEQHRK